MLWAFGQLVNHDISETTTKPGDLCNIPVAKNDPFLDDSVEFIPMNRSNSILDSMSGVAQQTSKLSPFVDADNVYGNAMTRLNFIRADDSNVTGRLRTSGPNFLPKNTEGLTNKGHDTRTDFFLAGDVRANENSPLIVSHTLWMREHNYWADKLRSTHPKLSGDDIFNRTRVIIQAEMQKIVYDEFLPALLGEGAIPPYSGYDPDIDARVENVVSSCAFRIGHTMVGPGILLDYGNGTINGLSMEDTFNNPSQIERVGGIDAFLRGMTSNVCQEVDPFIVPSLRNHLFNNQFDLLAINIERARDHGIPDFNSIRASLGFDKLDSFDDFLFSQELASVYSNTDQIDCWIGMNSEPRIDGLMVGETQRAVLARNFANIRDGDPNFYKNSITDDKLLEMIEGTTFADVIRRNSDQPGSLDDVRDDVFFVQAKERLFY
jgi:peroxidase